MNTENYQITVNDLPVNIVRKAIKNLHLGVYPPNGRVRVAAPLHVSDEAIRLAVITRLAWIKRQQVKFAVQERQSAREFITGESHYFQGQRYRLNVVYQNGPGVAVIRNKTGIDLIVRENSDIVHRRKVLFSWYRQQLKALIPSFLKKWELLIGVQVADWGVKQMKTRWGVCNNKARRIWLNLALIKKPPHCLEYVIVHEMVHLLERGHNDRFKKLMSQFIPQWRLYRAELNREPLGYEVWNY